jgi:tetratricopeptide (TPR) repeat protein
MSRTRKIVKKKLKEPDEFITLTERTYLFLKRHAKPVGAGVMIVLVLILAVLFYQRWEKKKEGNAYQLFTLAMETYQAASTPYKEGSPEQYRNVLEKFDEVIAKFPGTSAGKLSILFKGNLDLRLGEFDEAIKAYNAFLQKAGKEKLYRIFALEGLGYSYEGKKDYEKALSVYQKILEFGEDFQLADAYLGMGRCCEKLGKNKEALENYKNFTKIAKKSNEMNAILRKISLLEK